MRRLLVFLLPAAALAWYFLAGPASGSRCGILLDSVSEPAGFPGDTVELRGRWGAEQGEKRPCLEGPENVFLPVLSWSGAALKVRLPETLPPGRYKLGVYCGEPSPGQVFPSGWRDFKVLKKRSGEDAAAQAPVAVPEPPAAPEPAAVPQGEPPAPEPAAEPAPAAPAPPAVPKPRSLGSPPNLRLWFWNHSKLRDALVWENAIGGKETYTHWPESRKRELDRYFQLAWEGKPSGLADPPRNYFAGDDRELVRQDLAPEDALALYLATVAHSLTVEAGRLVPWSMEDYAPDQIAMLLSATEMFYRSGQYYSINTALAGKALPPPPETAWAFMAGLTGPDRRKTIVAVLDWMNRNLIHFEGAANAANYEAQWQYRGLPPVTRMLAGTPYTGKAYAGVKHRTAGCGGSSGFLRAVLRSVNIPVAVLQRCRHIMPAFPTEKLYLSHGDDPYGNWGKPYPCGVEHLLIGEDVFNSWFASGADCKDSVGRGAREAAARNCGK